LLDPVSPPRTKSAAVKKPMPILSLAPAHAEGRRRRGLCCAEQRVVAVVVVVVVKRPIEAEPAARNHGAQLRADGRRPTTIGTCTNRRSQDIVDTASCPCVGNVWIYSMSSRPPSCQIIPEGTAAIAHDGATAIRPAPMGRPSSGRPARCPFAAGGHRPRLRRYPPTITGTATRGSSCAAPEQVLETRGRRLPHPNLSPDPMEPCVPSGVAVVVRWKSASTLSRPARRIWMRRAAARAVVVMTMMIRSADNVAAAADDDASTDDDGQSRCCMQSLVPAPPTCSSCSRSDNARTIPLYRRCCSSAACPHVAEGRRASPL
jgi:hypothetical protein